MKSEYMTVTCPTCANDEDWVGCESCSGTRKLVIKIPQARESRLHSFLVWLAFVVLLGSAIYGIMILRWPR